MDEWQVFSSGETVVCVDDRNWLHPTSNVELGPKKGSHYTIDMVFFEFVSLVEYPPHDGYIDLYLARRFRPITKKKTDISVFKEILEKINKGAKTEVV